MAQFNCLGQDSGAKLPRRLRKAQQEFLKEQYELPEFGTIALEKGRTAKDDKEIRKQIIESEKNFWNTYRPFISTIDRLEILRKYTVDSRDPVFAFAVGTDYSSYSGQDYSYTTVYLWRPGDKLIRFGHFNNSWKIDFAKYLDILDSYPRSQYSRLISDTDSEC